MRGEHITVRGQVQGVGFRPAVWRLATELGLAGDVCNTPEGVEIRVFGAGAGLDAFARRLVAEAPPLARVDTLARRPVEAEPPPGGFAIAPSAAGAMRAAVTPDIATCADCLAEARDPFARRYRYPFTNCTNCGPRFSIVTGAPYDRALTTMQGFAPCPDCGAEYGDPADRRFHAQPIACHACGPRAWIERLGGGAVAFDAFSMLDPVDAVGGMIAKGHIVAIKGLGGFHLACDATDAAAVAALRQRKRRPAKAFALMARDIDVIRRFCVVDAAETALLQSPQAPIVLLRRRATAAGAPLAAEVAPGLDRLGFMLPTTPLHHLALRRLDRPVVMTSGNISGQPQCVHNEEARAALAGVAAFALMHNRPIAHRLDDSVARVDLGRPRLLRRARGYAPAALPLPPGLEAGPSVLALGAELKNTLCLTRDGEAVLSQHLGDLADAATASEAADTLALYQRLFDHVPQAIAVDAHPAYRATRDGHARAAARGVPVVEVQHHHAHIAACLAENRWPAWAAERYGAARGGEVLGIALDGTGAGDDGTVWGGEFLACDYAGYRRLGCLKPVALPGGEAAVREPWRNAYAHLRAEMGWAELEMNFAHLPVFARLSALPRATLDAMIAAGVNAPLASSCGRLFDAAAALCGLAWDRQDHEGQAAMAFEAAIDPAAMAEPDDLAYPFAIPLLRGRGLPYIEPLAAWRALLGDLCLDTPAGTIAARFHRGFARAVVAMARKLAGTERRFATVALGGGCFQNATLFALVHDGLRAAGFDVLSPATVPANDGGLAFGQAVVALARLAARDKPGDQPCV